MTAVAVHVVNQDVVSACDSDTVVLVDNDAVTNCGVIGASQVESVAVV